MYTKEEREGILWEFHRSGLSAPRRLQEPAAFPEQGQPVCLAQAGGGGRADRPRDARPGGVHALLARRGQPRVRLPTEASSRRGRGQNEEDRARRGRRRGTRADGMAGLGPGGASGRPRRARPRGRGQARRRWSTGRTVRRSSGGCGHRKRRDRPRRSRPRPGRAPTPGRGTARPGSGPASSARRRSGRRWTRWRRRRARRPACAICAWRCVAACASSGRRPRAIDG